MVQIPRKFVIMDVVIADVPPHMACFYLDIGKCPSIGGNIQLYL